MIQIGNATVHFGNNLDVLPTLPDNSVDSIVTDPPYELGFMGKTWDNSGIAYSVELWQECLRVLKPGGHLLAFGGSRTWHRLAVAIEDAGFEMRDSIAWLYGSGFPKSLDIAKQLNKMAGVEFEAKPASGVGFMNATDDGYNTPLNQLTQVGDSTPEAQKWQGWGTALKPAFEPIVVARKPLIGTVAANVLEWGTGGLNIDDSRIGTEVLPEQKAGQAQMGTFERDEMITPERIGRWPANIILDEYTAGLLDQQSGESKSPKTYKRNADGFGQTSFGVGEPAGTESLNYGDTGGASRFFYVAKASKRDRNEGLEHLENGRIPYESHRPNFENTKGVETSFAGAGRSGNDLKNFHPTVKPTALMEYLINLVTPENGTVLDPFTGSGSTGKAALLKGFKFIGIELTEEYLPIIEGRLRHADKTANEGLFN